MCENDLIRNLRRLQYRRGLLRPYESDEFTREALATNAARRITAAGTMAILDQIREQRGAPQFLRMDNGPEFIAETLRDWYKEQNIKANYCDPGSP